LKLAVYAAQAVILLAMSFAIGRINFGQMVLWVALLGAYNLSVQVQSYLNLKPLFRSDDFDN